MKVLFRNALSQLLIFKRGEVGFYMLCHILAFCLNVVLRKTNIIKL